MSRNQDWFPLKISSETDIVKALNPEAGNLPLMQCH